MLSLIYKKFTIIEICVYKTKVVNIDRIFKLGEFRNILGTQYKWLH